MNSAAPFREYAITVAPEWIDENGHMNVLYYSHVVFAANVAFSRYLQLDESYVHSTGFGINVVESHLVYERELLLGDRIEVASRLLAVDNKRIHIYHEVFNVERNYRAAVGEQLNIHVDLTARRAANFPDAERVRLEGIARLHAQLPTPDKSGRSVAMVRR